MEPRYLLDTNTCIYLRQQRPESVVRRFNSLRQGEVGLSVVTYGELLFGARKSKNSARALLRLTELAILIPPLALPINSAESYGIIRTELETRGQMIGNNDLWIAAHALAAGLILVTNNEREFRRVQGLRIENWV